MKRQRVTIIGGGIIGLCSAFYLAERDHAVTVLESDGFGAGASHGNAGWITPSLSGPVPAPGVVGQSLRWMFRGDSPLYIKPRFDPALLTWLLRFWRNCSQRVFQSGLKATAELNQQTFELFDSLADRIDFERHETGLLFAFTDRTKLEHHLEALELMRPFGYSPEILSPEAAAALEPALRPDLPGAIWIEQERHVRPDALITALVKALIDLGVELRPGSPVTGFRINGRRVHSVTTPDGDIASDAFLIAAGVETTPLARMLGTRIPIVAGKGYSIDFEPPPIAIRHSLYLYESRVAVTPLTGVVRLAGTMEFSGLNGHLDAVRIQAVKRAANRYLQGWSASVEGAQPWAGMRPMTPDGLPVIGPLPRLDNAYVASGHAMLGVTLGPATGHAVAEMIGRQAVPNVLRPFDPGRFMHRV